MTKARFWLLAALLLVIATLLRVVDLSADPPANFADRSQDLTTDGSYITYYARNEAIFDSKTIVDDEVWQFIDMSLVSNMARLIFSLGSVSLKSTNLAGAIPNLFGLFLFALAFIKGKNGYLNVLFVLMILAVNYPLIVYGRVPLAENGLIFFTGLTALIFSFWHKQTFGFVALGITIALAGFFGKVFGFLLIIPALLAVYRIVKPNRLRNCSVLLGAFGFGAVAILLLFYGDSNPLNIFWSMGVTSHGFPDGLSSISGFFEKLILFGYKGLFKYAPILSILFWLMVSIRLLATSKLNRLSGFELFLIGSTTTVWVLLSPFNYLPLRYLIFLYLPMTGFVVLSLTNLMNSSIELGGRISKSKFVPLFFLNWLFSMHAIVLPLKEMLQIDKPADSVWMSLLVAVLISGGELYLLKEKRLLPQLTGSLKPVVLSLILIVGVGMLQYGCWYSNRNYSIQYASEDVGSIVRDGAIIAGQDGPALSVGTNIMSYPYFLTPDIEELKEKLTKYPITHVALLKDSWNQLIQKWQPLGKLPIIGRFMVRNNLIYLIRLSDLRLNNQSKIYRKSAYERGIDYQIIGQRDSALVYHQLHLENNKLSRAGLLEMFYLHASRGELEQCTPIVQTLVENYPTDFSVHLMKAILFKALSKQKNDHGLLKEAEISLALSIQNFNDNEVNINKAYDKFVPQQRTIY